MKSEAQVEFNNKVTEHSHNKFCEALNTELGVTIEYRVAEMPVFVSNEFRTTLERCAVEIIEQCSMETNRRRTDPTLEPRFTVPNESAKPLFSVVDFAVTQDEAGNYVPKLIELQGFPSLFGYQYLYAQRMIEHYGVKGATPFLSGLSEEQYWKRLRASIYGNAPEDETVLMEIDPQEQKTVTDFIVLKKFISLNTANIRDIAVEDSRFVWHDGTNKKPVSRVFNRAIIDELDDLGVELQWNWNDSTNVEWAGHPNWYFRISKFLLPYILHEASPTTHFLHMIDTLPDLSTVVLKPLYSFAGKGVNVKPTEADIKAIPARERSNWILQEKVQYAPCVPTPAGNNFVEIRVMLIWDEHDTRPVPVISMARTGRKSMMGARYNVDPWTGSSGCLFVE